jgi:hypothetical protein
MIEARAVMTGEVGEVLQKTGGCGWEGVGGDQSCVQPPAWYLEG